MAEQAIILKSGICGSLVYSITASHIFMKNIADDQSPTLYFDIEMLKVKDVVDIIIGEDLVFIYLLTGNCCLWSCK